MTKLLVIVALVALSFAALLIYGVGRDDPAASANPNDPRRALPADPPPDENDLENWEPPSFAEKTEPLQVRFASGLFEREREVQVQAGAIATTLAVPPLPLNANDKDSARIAKLRLLQGDLASATADAPEGEESLVCLCRKGVLIPAETIQSCDRRFRDKVTAAGQLCPSGLNRRALAITRVARTIDLTAPNGARILVR